MQMNQIGGYEIIDLVGEGGQGAVYRAQDPSSGQTVAIKILSHSSSDGEFLDRFQREASIMATIRHPNVVEVYDHGEEDGKHYIVTEFVSDNLEETLKRRKTLPLARAASVATQIASALEVSHNAGITHRDIKPANVLINDSGDVKLTDFGIATAESLDSMTSENTTVGTPLYMSPEQIQGSPNIDGRSDLYSLGCLLYETVVGSAPFEGNSTYEIFDGHIKGTHEALTEHSEEAPELLDSIIALLLKKERDERYQSASDLIKDLMELKELIATGPSDVSRTRVMPKVLGTQKISTQNTPYSQGLPKWLIPLGGIIGLIVILIIGGVFFLSGSGNSNVGAAVGISNELSGDSDSNRTSENLPPSASKEISSGSQSKGISFEKPGQDILSAYAVDPMLAIETMTNLVQLDPKEGIHALFEMDQTNMDLTAEFLRNLAMENPDLLKTLLEHGADSDLGVTARILNNLLEVDLDLTLTFFRDNALSHPGSLALYEPLIVKTFQVDHRNAASFLNKVGIEYKSFNETFRYVLGNSLVNLISQDMETSIDLFLETSRSANPLWSDLIRFDGEKGINSGTLFLENHKTARPEITIERLEDIIREGDNGGSYLLTMAGEDPTETSLILTKIVEAQNVSPSEIANALRSGAYSTWNGVDYNAIEEILHQNPSFVSYIGKEIDPQIWMDMAMPWPGLGSYGEGIWSDIPLDHTPGDVASQVSFNELLVKTLDPSQVEDAVVSIQDITSDMKKKDDFTSILEKLSGEDRFVNSYFLMTADKFYENDISAVISFDLPLGHFLPEIGYDAHPWSVQLSRFDSDSKTWNPISANTDSYNPTISSENTDQYLTFNVPIADLAQNSESIWAITTAKGRENSILGSPIEIGNFKAATTGHHQVELSGSISNTSRSLFHRDLAIFIDSIPEYTYALKLKPKENIQLKERLIIESGSKNIVFADKHLAFENLYLGGTLVRNGSGQLNEGSPQSGSVAATHQDSAGRDKGTTSFPTSGDQEDSKLIKLTIPSQPDLIADDDTGLSNTDNITSSRKLTFTGTSDPDLPVRLVLYVNHELGGSDHVVLGQVQPNENGIWEITTSQIPEGPQSIYAIPVLKDGSVDRENHRSETFRFEIDQTPPSPSYFSYDSRGGYGTIKIDGSSEPYSLIEIQGIGGRLGLSGGSTEVSLASTVANENGRWELEIADLGPGDHQITKYEIDVAGNRSRGSEPKTFSVRYPDGSASVPSFKKLPDYLDGNLQREYLSPHAAEIILAYKEDPDTGVSLLSKLVHKNSNDATLALFAITQNCSYQWDEAVRKSFDFIPDEICSNRKLDDSKIPVELFSKLAVTHPSGANLILESGIHHDLFLTSMLFSNLAQRNALETVSLLDFYYSECGDGIEDWTKATSISHCPENVENLLLQSFRTDRGAMASFISHLGEAFLLDGKEHVGSHIFQKSLSQSMNELISQNFEIANDSFGMTSEKGIHVWLNMANFSDKNVSYPAWGNLHLKDTYAHDLGRLITDAHQDRNLDSNVGRRTGNSSWHQLHQKITPLFHNMHEDGPLLIYLMADVDMAETSLLLHTLLLQSREGASQYDADRETDKIITAVIQTEDINQQRQSLYGEKRLNILRTLLEYYPDLPSLLSENGKFHLNDAL